MPKLRDAWIGRGSSLAQGLLALLLLHGCATSEPRVSPPAGTPEPEGFTVSEQVHVSDAVRADFEAGLELLEKEQYDEGIALLVGVTEAAPGATAAHIDLAIAYAKRGDLERAEASAERALEANPRHPVAHNELGIIYRKTGRLQKARKSYERALKLYPEFHFARRNLAILCDVYLADPECALEHYEIYVEAVPQDAAAAMWMTDLRERLTR